MSQQKRFFGRENEIQELLSRINTKQNSVTYIEGESGVGKTALLKELHERLTYKDTKFLVGSYYGMFEPPSLFSPFLSALETLILMAKKTERLKEKLGSTISRLEKALKRYAKERTTEIVGAILCDLAGRFGLKETLKEARRLVSHLKDEPSILTLAMDYAAKHKSDEIIESFNELIQILLDTFSERTFVLLFDHFECVRSAAINFLLTLIDKMRDKPRFHIIVCFTPELHWYNDEPNFTLYSYASTHLERLGAKRIRLRGLSLEAVREWIKSVKKQDVSDILMMKIMKRSAGYPLVLKDWMCSFEDLDYYNIDRSNICSYVYRRKKGLDSNEQKSLKKMAVPRKSPLRYSTDNIWSVFF